MKNNQKFANGEQVRVYNGNKQYNAKIVGYHYSEAKEEWVYDVQIEGKDTLNWAYEFEIESL